MKLFVYGSLKYPEIVYALTGKNPLAIDAVVSGYKVVALKNKPYPGLIVSDTLSAIGKIIDVDEESYAVISDWEDIEYTLIEIIASVDDNHIKAFTFLHNAKAEQLTTDWDEKNFKNNYLKDYVNNRIPIFLNNNSSN